MECVICLDPLFKTKEGLVTLQCGHLFHNSCLIGSLEKNPACPICRKVASKEQIIKIYLDSDGALGECKDCAENKKELEEFLEKVFNALDAAVESHKKQQQKLKAKIESLKQKLKKEKQKGKAPKISLIPKVAENAEPVKNTVTMERQKKEEKALEISAELPLPPPHSIVKKEELQEKISIEGYTIEVLGGYAPNCYLTTYDNGAFKIEIQAENLQDVWESVMIYPRNNCMYIFAPTVAEGNPFKRLIKIQANSGKSVENLQKQYFHENVDRIVIDLK